MTGEPERRSLGAGSPGSLLSVDVEEWYHNCWVPEYVDPARRPALPEELERLIPALLELLDRAGARATFFVLGELAARCAPMLRAARRAGHEIACHGHVHLRANDRSPEAFRADLELARKELEDAVGGPILGFRAPEWSLRDSANPRFRLVAEAGFLYDSSLAPAPGAGSRSNPREVTRFVWADGTELIELPPLTWAGDFRLPAAGWTARLLPAAYLGRVAARATREGRRPLFVVHPWELVDRECPGTFTGLARFFHEAGRAGYRGRFECLLERLSFRETLAEAVGAARTVEGEARAPRTDLEETWAAAAPTEVA
jgi:polysaccharide deacetylase family protein (PEP-CTERM system associated)